MRNGEPVKQIGTAAIPEQASTTRTMCNLLHDLAHGSYHWDIMTAHPEVTTDSGLPALALRKDVTHLDFGQVGILGEAQRAAHKGLGALHPVHLHPLLILVFLRKGKTGRAHGAELEGAVPLRHHA